MMPATHSRNPAAFHTLIFQLSSSGRVTAGPHLADYKGVQRNHNITMRLLAQALYGKRIHTKQLIIFLDGPAHSSYSRKVYSEMFKTLCDIFLFDRLDRPPDVHLVFRDIDAYMWYMSVTSKSGALRVKWREMRSRVTTIYLADLDVTEKNFFTRTHAIRRTGKMGWYWIPERQDITEHYLCKIEETLHSVRSCQMIAKKASLGEIQDEDYLAWFINLYLKLKDHLADKPELWKKIRLDPCIKACATCRKNSCGCAANIGMAHLWPNGFATGCPYHTSVSFTRQVKDVARGQAFLRNVRNRYDWDKCSLRTAYTNARKKILDSPSEI